METVAAAAIIVIQVGTVMLSHLKGKRGSVNMDGKLTRLGQDLRQAIDNRSDLLTQDMTGIAQKVDKLESHVIGPDGQNGLRGDVRKLQSELAQLAPRKLVSARRR